MNPDDIIEITPPAARLTINTLDNIVTLRVHARTHEQIRELAAAEHITISAWIRRTVIRELSKQSPR